MSRQAWFTTLLLIGILLAASCSPKQITPTPGANMPNPASVYCEQNGGKLDIRTAADGSQSGVCVFANGSECDEWAYYRGECKPAGATSAAATVEVASDGWKIYRNEKLGYSFHYPADANIVTNDDPLKRLTANSTPNMTCSGDAPSWHRSY